MNPLFNCILIDLTLFNKGREVKQFLESCNLESKISYGELWAMKNGCFLSTDRIYKVWFDATTFQVIGYSTQREQNFSKNFIDFLIGMKPIEAGQTFQQLVPEETKIELTVDNILDKIRIKGINSLTNEEKKFLDSN